MAARVQVTYGSLLVCGALERIRFACEGLPAYPTLFDDPNSHPSFKQKHSSAFYLVFLSYGPNITDGYVAQWQRIRFACEGSRVRTPAYPALFDDPNSHPSFKQMP